MAHNLHIENGKASMMYVDEPPWHGLGTALKEPATAQQAITAANLDWEVVKKPLLAFDGKVSHPIPDRFAIIRQDWLGQPKPIFGIVGTEYTPLQNRDAFAFFDAIVGEKAAIYHTAGALGDGERVWVLAKLPSDIRVIGDDIANKFLLLSNSHDGSSAVQIKFTPIRVVCQNTLTMALSQGRILRVPHVKSLRERMREAGDMLGIINDQFQSIEVKFGEMAHRQMNTEQLGRYLHLVFPDPQDTKNRDALAKAKGNRLWSTYFFEQGKGSGLPGVKGTLWAAYNGVAELVDHRQPQRGERQPAPALFSGPAQPPDERRLESAWFGDGYSAKVRAYREACKLLAAQ
jgi:phage/plasmid-like protein (TIGR03299 family)